jgi:hypothetical protein
VVNIFYIIFWVFIGIAFACAIGALVCQMILRHKERCLRCERYISAHAIYWRPFER